MCILANRPAKVVGQLKAENHCHWGDDRAAAGLGGGEAGEDCPTVTTAAFLLLTVKDYFKQ